MVKSNQLDLKIDTCCFLARCSTLLGKGKEWLAQCQDSATEWDIRLWCWNASLPVGKHYKVTMIVRCHKSVPVLI